MGDCTLDTILTRSEEMRDALAARELREDVGEYKDTVELQQR